MGAATTRQRAARRGRPRALFRLGLTATALVALIGGFAVPASAKTKATTRVVSASTVLSTANATPRIEAPCPKGTSAYGGGMIADPAPGADGEGVYPHIFERIGIQNGWHVTPVLFDSAAPTTPRTVTVQAVCGPNPGKVAAVRTGLQVNPGESQTTTATCPPGRHLIAGGFQQTDFTSKGGDFVTQSQAVGNNAWTASASAFGTFGGQVYAVAYCVKGKSSWQEVDGPPTAIGPGASATSTTPPCPAGRRLVAGGVSTSPSGAVFFGNGAINSDQSFSASGYDRSTAPATVTAYGYCLRPMAAKSAKKK